MKNYLIYILLIASFIASAQRKSKVYQEDFDGDGITDELVIMYYLGKVEKAKISYANKTKSCVFDVAPKAKEPSLINIIPICDELLEDKFLPLTQFIDSLIFESPAASKIDPSLGWLLDAYASRRNLSNDPFFNNYSRFKSQWNPNYYSAPVNHRLLLKGGLAKKINQLHLKSDTTEKSWVIFDAEPISTAEQISQFILEPNYPIFVDSADGISLFKTGHSVYLERDTGHQIIYVSDGILFNNIQKIHWESIQQVATYLDYVVILSHPYPAITNKLYFVDPKKGKVFEFKDEVVLEMDYGFWNISSFQIIDTEMFLYLKEAPSATDIIEKQVSLGPILDHIQK